MEIDVPLKTPIAEGDPAAADGGTVGTGSRGSGGLGGTSIDEACSRRPTEKREEPSGFRKRESVIWRIARKPEKTLKKACELL
jgi:hypothetical protein